MPACRKTPADAAVAHALQVPVGRRLAIDLETKPDVSGTKMAAAQMRRTAAWCGRPPSSEHLRRPVMAARPEPAVGSSAL